MDKVNDRPKYIHSGDSGADIRADLEFDINLGPSETRLVPTGIYLGIPDNYEVQIRTRSGMALKNDLTVKNSPGTVDKNFTGLVCCIIYNTNKYETKKISKGDRIAQMVLCPVVQADFEFVDSLEQTDRNSGGFGSTGVS